MISLPTSPNDRYRALLHAARQLTGTAIIDRVRPPSQSQALRFLSENRQTLLRARELIRQGCSVPVRHELSYLDELADSLGALRRLARSLQFATRHSARDEIEPPFLEGCRDLLLLAQGLRCGGLILNFQLSVSVAAMALAEIRSHANRLTDANKRLLIPVLLQFETDLEPVDQILERDARWEAETEYEEERPDWTTLIDDFDAEESGLAPSQVDALQAALVELWNQSPGERSSVHRLSDQRQAALFRMQAIDLAIGGFLQHHGRLPNMLVELEENWLPQVPTDPFTGGEFRYHSDHARRYRLYSCGPTGIDHGGQWGCWFDVVAGKADLGLDTESVLK